MNNQGKRPDQTKTSEKIVFYSMVGIIILIIIQSIIDIMSNK